MTAPAGDVASQMYEQYSQHNASGIDQNIAELTAAMGDELQGFIHSADRRTEEKNGCVCVFPDG